MAPVTSYFPRHRLIGIQCREPLVCASPWETVYNDNDITVATRAVPDSPIRAFHAETTVAAPVDSILALMANPNDCALWIHGCLGRSAYS